MTLRPALVGNRLLISARPGTDTDTDIDPSQAA